MATKHPRVQVTVDPELAEAMAAVDAHPKSRSRLIRDLALRGAEVVADEHQRHDEAKEFLPQSREWGIDLDMTGAREAHEEREAEVE